VRISAKVPRGAQEDDLLDAFAALWTAERIHDGVAQTLGDAHADRTGLPMRIVY
jgi:predicted RNase H-like nuclease